MTHIRKITEDENYYHLEMRNDALKTELDSMLLKSATLQKMADDTPLYVLKEVFTTAFLHIALGYKQDKIEGFIPSLDFYKYLDGWESFVLNTCKTTAQSILDVGVESGILTTKYEEGTPIVVGFSKEEYLHHFSEIKVKWV